MQSQSQYSSSFPCLLLQVVLNLVRSELCFTGVFHEGQMVRSVASPRIEKYGAQLTQVKSVKRDAKDDPIPSCWDIFQRRLVGPHIFLPCLQYRRRHRSLGDMYDCMADRLCSSVGWASSPSAVVEDADMTAKVLRLLG
ncbi:MAG: hypothetical protein J3R72DRAFT_445492 [Linnemannia gamsii]|nr:MAG: hypothetical protein J3R72DRAFT_445492 [Linnemannia gamsii]